MAERMQRLRLRQLDEALKEWKNLGSRPERGWIRTLREALGMTLSDLARRLDLTFQAVAQLEKAERKGTITLSRLETVANALECDLVYALVPRGTLQVFLEKEARRRARRMLDRVRHSMSLEAQDISERESEHQLQELTDELLSGSWRTIWKEL
jgi:predicted DNA-binding mobile mystery protein A